MLKPDLILFTLNEHLYKPLSAIAPTVAVPSTFSDLVSGSQAYFKVTLRYIAKLLSQETKAEKVLDEYQKRVDQLKRQLENQLEKLEIAVIFYDEGSIHTITNHMNSLAPSIFNEVGLRYKFSPFNGDYRPPLSLETISEYDADILFIVNVAERPSSFYFQHPMFSSLKAVKNDRAYVVNQEIWNAQGILGANKILDDLFKYLVDQP
jgi:iron complex transport system substrate-binding protein